MKIRELIEHLKTFPPELQVFTTWEGTINEIEADGIYIPGRQVIFGPEAPSLVVLIDAEGTRFGKE